MLRESIVRHLTCTYYDFERLADHPNWIREGGAEALHLVHWWSCAAHDDVVVCFLKLIARGERVRIEVSMTADPYATEAAPIYGASCTVASWREYGERFVNGIMHTGMAIVDAICDDIDDMQSGEDTADEAR